MRVKICGLKTEHEVAAAVEAGADAVGFLVGQVYASHDFILASTAMRLARMLPPYVAPVLVTHLTEPEAVLELLEQTSIQTIQLHGGSTPDEVAVLRERLGASAKLIVAAHVLSSGVEPALEPYYKVADAIVLDSLDSGTGRVGGTGLTHDWDRSASIVSSAPLPVILAGGLSPDNVVQAVRKVHPFAVDANSALKGVDGMLDLNLCSAFIRNAKHSME